MKRAVHVIGLQKYAHGFTGCVETPDHYEFFHFGRGSYKVVRQYPKLDFEDRDHFIETMRKFVRAGFFQSPSAAVSGISADELEQMLSFRSP